MKSVLIVEDDEFKLESLEECLLHFQFDITISRSFSSAAKLIKRTTFDLIILDMSLPTFDGSGFSDEGEAQGLGGKRLIRLCDEYGTLCNTILVTQFSNFEEVGRVSSVVDLTEDLRLILNDLFLGVVRYDRASSDWRVELEKLLGIGLGNFSKAKK